MYDVILTDAQGKVMVNRPHRPSTKVSHLFISARTVSLPVCNVVTLQNANNDDARVFLHSTFFRQSEKPPSGGFTDPGQRIRRTISAKLQPKWAMRSGWAPSAVLSRRGFAKSSAYSCPFYHCLQTIRNEGGAHDKGAWHSRPCQISSTRTSLKGLHLLSSRL